MCENKIKHGYWYGEGDGYADGSMVYDMWYCSECGTRFEEWDEKPTWKYCPECGAKMNFYNSERENFSIRTGDLEIRSTPDVDGVTFELVKWYGTRNGNEHCYTLGYFDKDNFTFVGERFNDIEETQYRTFFFMLNRTFDYLLENNIIDS